MVNYMVSIKDVAKQAGVAISTVSKVLNNYPNVSDKTREKVNRAVAELNFVPNSVAAALSSKQAGRVALLMDINIKTNAFFEIDMQYISGALNKAMDLNLDVITLFFFMFRNRNVEEIIRYLQSQSIAGIIIYGLSKDNKVLHQLIASEEFKCVVVDAPIMNKSTSCVGIDHKKAQYDVAKKTIEENDCKRILYIAGKRNGYVSEERLAGMQQLIREMQLTMLVRGGEFSELQARNITMKYARNKDAVVCASDLMAIGAMKALMEMDIFRPVSGFDGLILMGYAGQQMNTVSQNFDHVSEAAMEELQRLLDGGEGRKLVLPHTLVRMKYEDIIR